MKIKIWVMLALVGFLASACSIKKMAIRQMVGTMQESKKVFEQENDLDLAEVALGSNLKLLEGLQVHDPENAQLNLFLAEGYSSYALAFVEDKFEQYEYTDEDKADYHRKRAINFYNRARKYAGIVLADLLDVDDPNKIPELEDKDLKARLDKLDKDDIAAVFWYAMSWGSATNLDRENMEALAQLSKIEMMMAKVKEWDPSFYYAGPYMFEGVYYGSRTKMLNGDPERSVKAFKKALEITKKKFLIIPYFYAKTYCVQYQNQKCFEENLNYVIETPADILPEQILANTLAKRKAERLLKLKDELFLSDE
ncbi:MAG: hypothetical protein D6767_07630 [Candidatus Hydrogenedentota bacterium]|nr:MAG: hypothetical protein D6767_07630 [Candidatus Hydrogenedentota bacterium]